MAKISNDFINMNYIIEELKNNNFYQIHSEIITGTTNQNGDINLWTDLNKIPLMAFYENSFVHFALRSNSIGYRARIYTIATGGSYTPRADTNVNLKIYYINI